MNTLIIQSAFARVAMAVGLLLVPLFLATPTHASAPNWDVTGSYVIAVNYLGSDYPHDVVLAQDNQGALSGSGGSPAGANVYTWVVTSGEVDDDTIDFMADYTATADAVTPQTTMHVVGTIAPDGSLSGTWSDNYQGESRSGTWMSTSGVAAMLPGALAAEDFGVVSYDTGLGMLKGYTAGFGLTDATFSGVQSVVVQLFSSSTLLQTNTATPKVGTDITGAQISSPFDVSGTFDYATDGYWTNVKEVQYGQSVPATRVVATVTLANGKVVTAENTSLTGDPTTIYPEPPATSSPTRIEQCKNGGWKTFTDPVFESKRECILFVKNLPQPPLPYPTHKSQCKNDGWKTFTDPVFESKKECILFVKQQHDDDEDEDEDEDEEEHEYEHEEEYVDENGVHHHHHYHSKSGGNGDSASESSEEGAAMNTESSNASLDSSSVKEEESPVIVNVTNQDQDDENRNSEDEEDDEDEEDQSDENEEDHEEDRG